MSTLNSVQSTKVENEKELARLRQSHEELKDRTGIMNDSFRLKEQLDNERKTIAALESKVSALEGEITLKDSSLKTLEYELDVSRRSLLVQNKFENVNSFAASFGCNRELLRELYFEMGKKAADNHALSLSIAEMAQSLESMTNQLNSIKERNEELELDNSELKDTVAAKDENIRYRDEEISKLHDANNQLHEFIDKMNAQIEDQVKTIAELRIHQEELFREQQFKVDSLAQERDDLEADNHALKLNMSSLESTALQLEKTVKEKELRDQNEKDALIEELQNKNDQIQGLNQELADKEEVSFLERFPCPRLFEYILCRRSFYITFLCFDS